MFSLRDKIKLRKRKTPFAPCLFMIRIGGTHRKNCVQIKWMRRKVDVLRCFKCLLKGRSANLQYYISLSWLESAGRDIKRRGCVLAAADNAVGEENKLNLNRKMTMEGLKACGAAFFHECASENMKFEAVKGRFN